MGTILKKPESSVINTGNTTQYIQLNKKAHEGDPIPVYLCFSNESLVYIKQMEQA